MPQQKLRTPEAIQRGGFQGGTFVQPVQEAPATGLTELAGALGRLSPSLDRAMVTRETNRVDGLRQEAEDEAARIQAEFTGYTAAQIGEALESEPLAERFRQNPYIMPALQVHRGRVSADELAQAMVESGVNPSDPEAVNAFLQENAPQSDDAFFARGLNEQMERFRSQWTQQQLRSTLEQAEAERMDMGQREFDTVYQDTGDWSAAFEALANVQGIDPRERTDIQMAAAQRLADAGEVDALEALLTTPRGDAPPLADVGRLAQNVGILRNRAEVRSEAATREAGYETLGSLREAVYAGRFPSTDALERSPEYQSLTAGQRLQASGYVLSYMREQERELEVEQRRMERERTARDEDEAVMRVDDMIAQGLSFEEIEASDAYANLGSREAVVRRRMRAGSGTSSSRQARAAWEADVEESQGFSDAHAIITGEAPLWEEVTHASSELDAVHTVTANQRRAAAVPHLRQALLGDDPWNQPEGQQARYAQYARVLARSGLQDPQLEQIMGSARGLLTTENVVLPGSVESTRRVYDIYTQLDRASRSSFVPDSRTRAVLARAEAFMAQNPEADFGEVLHTATAQHELAADMQESYDRDFTRYERSIDYSIEKPSGGSINAARLDRWRSSSGARQNDPVAEVRMFVQERFLEYRAAGHSADEAAQLASEDIDAEWTVYNERPLRLPPNRTGGSTTAPLQWANAVETFVEAEAYEHGIEDPDDITVSHLDNGVFAFRRPDGTYRIAHANMVMGEAGHWIQHSLPREQREAAREAGALPTNQ